VTFTFVTLIEKPVISLDSIDAENEFESLDSHELAGFFVALLAPAFNLLPAPLEAAAPPAVAIVGSAIPSNLSSSSDSVF
jgi:hypothetical protein